MNKKNIIKKIGKTAKFTRLMLEINKRVCLSLYRKKIHSFEHGSEWKICITSNHIIKTI